MTDLEILRRTIARELETINQYEADAARAEDPRVKKFLSHLAWEEKEHVSEGMAMLRLLDSRQRELDGRGTHFLEEAVEAEVAASGARTAAASPPAQGGAPSGETAVIKPPKEPHADGSPVAAFFSGRNEFTVGCLRGGRRNDDHGPLGKERMEP
ncbi:MAG: hypothetical protein D6729_11080 [Deltaproteobacteria bacterium]|nr:MAG: hypothetical protein D6729_11080 [Deltaproteobacteria bacterium]